jgi:hypothetical protein
MKNPSYDSLDCLFVGLAACMLHLSGHGISTVPKTRAFFSPETFEGNHHWKMLLCALSAATAYPEGEKSHITCDEWPFRCVASLLPSLQVAEGRAGDIVAPDPRHLETEAVTNSVISRNFEFDRSVPLGFGCDHFVLVRNQPNVGYDLASKAMKLHEHVLVRMCAALYRESAFQRFGLVFVMGDPGAVSQAA